MGKEKMVWTECHICGSKTYGITTDNKIYCTDCGTRVGTYSPE